MRQGAGKVKHLCGKLLWIQDCLMVDDIQLLKIIMLWNLADAAAKPLSGKRIKLLLHEINMATKQGLEIVASDEYEIQCKKHGSGKR